LALRRFVTLVGTGGIGKTTVAAAVAQSLDRSNPDTNVCFVDLQTVNHPSDVARFVASSVGCADHASRPEQALITYLSDRMICLILDIVNI
jgi:predicted ATPase